MRGPDLHPAFAAIALLITIGALVLWIMGLGPVPR
jgi:hypothetical protein